MINYSRINGVSTDYLNINDRAIHYGDGLFETILCSNNKLFYWKQHYQRLQLSSNKLKINCPDEQLLLNDISALVADNEAAACENSAKKCYVIKIIVSRGAGERGYLASTGADENRLVLRSTIEPEYSSLLAERLLKGSLYLCEQQVSINESLAGLKHLNRLENVMARNEWNKSKDKNIIDGLMINANHHVIEGTMSNLFAIKGDQLLTPDLTKSGVKGIMRDVIIDIANKNELKLSIVNMSINDLLVMDELFITNSLIGMKSINKLKECQYKEADVTKFIFERLLKEKQNNVQAI